MVIGTWSGILDTGAAWLHLKFMEGIAEPGAICLSEQLYQQVKSQLELAVSDRGNKDLKEVVSSAALGAGGGK